MLLLFPRYDVGASRGREKTGYSIDEPRNGDPEVVKPNETVPFAN